MALSKGFSISATLPAAGIDQTAHLPTLLFVDDEQEIVASLADLFRRNYHVLTATSADEALVLLRQHHVSVIVADQRMPGKTGSEFLAEVCMIDSDIVRIILTGYADIEAVIQAVNEGHIFYYLTKPWHSNELEAVIGKAMEHHHLLRDKRRLVDELYQTNAKLEQRVEERTAELRQSEQRQRSIFQTAMDGIWLTDEQGRLVEVNETYCQMSGYSRQELLTMSISDVEHLETACNLSSRIIKIMEQGEDRFESRHRRKDGSVYDVEVSIQYRSGDGGQFVVFLQDITERKQAQLALQQKNQEMEQFVYSVSHDLKSPLVTVKTFVGMLRKDMQDGNQPQINKDLNYIDQAADKMKQLLDALIQYSQIGSINTPVHTLSAGQLAENCLAALAGILRQHQVQVSTGKLPQQLHGAPLHFGQIWQNLIENAVKYKGDQSHPQIEIGSTQQAQDVVFYVRDNGMGIAPEHSERIFNLFSQLNPDSDGSGLGLALVKKIVTTYKGRIWVESAGKGKGSCFMFTLPGALIKDGSAT